ncbi:MAG: capsule biosynthesis protein [Sphingobium sp.]|uniref:capsule biosynthesis protein n=1 Tax=Sphingobium sp. TaxID=1912891 RepID=UPI002E23087E
MSLVDRSKGWVADARIRRRGYAAAAAVAALLCVVPQPYVARAKIVPQDSGSLGINSMMSALGGQFGTFAALLGGAKQPIDIFLSVARSPEVSVAVVQNLKLDDASEYGSRRAAQRALERKVDIHSLTGGIIEVEARTHDAAESERLTRAYVDAITARLNTLERERIRRKRAVIEKRFKDASLEVSKAEAALNVFRRNNNLAAPEVQLGSELTLRASLQAQLQAKQVEFQTMRQFQGDENPGLRALQTQIASLQAQIARTAAPATNAAGPNVAGLSDVLLRYFDLYRNYRFAQTMYEVYSRSTEEVTVEALAAETAADAQVIEAPNLDVDRKFNVPAAVLLALILLLAFFTEAYAPATAIRLPLISPVDREP